MNRRHLLYAFSTGAGAGVLATDLVKGLLNGSGYLVKRWIEKTGSKDEIDIQRMEIDRIRKLAELKRELDRTGETPESLQRFWESVAGIQAPGRAEPRAGVVGPSGRGLLCLVFSESEVGRVECRAERVGDVMLVFTGGGEASTKEQLLDVQVTLNVTIANPWMAGGLTSARLVLDSAGSQAGIQTKSSRGRLKPPLSSTILFERIPIVPPGPGSIATARITGLRANVSMLTPRARDIAPYPARAFVSIKPSVSGGTPTSVANAVVTVSAPQPGMVFDVWSRRSHGPPFRFGQAHEWNAGFLSGSKTQGATTSFNVRFRELFPAAFKTRAQEAGANVDDVTQGTRMMVKFSDVPEGVGVFVTTRDVAGAPREGSRSPQAPKAVIIPDADANGGGGTLPKPGLTPVGIGSTEDGLAIIRVQVHGGFAFAVWEWVSSDPLSSLIAEDVSFGVVLAPPQGLIHPGILSVAGSFAPLSTSYGPGSRIPGFLQEEVRVDAFAFDPSTGVSTRRPGLGPEPSRH